jgi:hypothetical protein
MEILEAREELEFATTEEEVDSIRKINKGGRRRAHHSYLPVAD